MTNQIARNFLIRGEEAAALATADHIASFWEPRMRAALLAGDDAGLQPAAARAVALLRRPVDPPHQTLATAVTGGSDAG